MSSLPGPARPNNSGVFLKPLVYLKIGLEAKKHIYTRIQANSVRDVTAFCVSEAIVIGRLPVALDARFMTGSGLQ